MRILLLMKMLTIRIDEELHKAFKIKCVTEGTDMNSVLVSLIESYVKAGKSKSKK
jgi:hypothetical protein